MKKKEQRCKRNKKTTGLKQAWKREESEGMKGEPTNCYTALWCHLSLLRHGSGIAGMVPSICFYSLIPPILYHR